MSTHFALGAVGYGRNITTAENVARVIERAHAMLESTRGPLTVRLNESRHDGILYLRRVGPLPDVEATFEHNPNRATTTIVPDWANQAVWHLSTLRVVRTRGFEAVER